MNSLLYDLFQAYYDARRNKRNTHSQLQFELDYESSLIKLHDELVSWTYQIWQSTCFLICDTVTREIFAANFRDRVVHHLLYNYMYDICDTQFINDSYSCRVWKGTHYGVKRVDYFIRSCSQNYRKDCYILKLDIKWFFMNIDKERLLYMLWHMIAPKRDKIQCSLWFDRLRSMFRKVIFHDPTKHYVFQWSRDLYKDLPTDKSLFASPVWVWLPIWNLTSQIFANIYLHKFDVWMKQHMWCRYYGRYVDDFIIVHPDKKFLTDAIPCIREYLEKEFWLILHPRKIYLQHYKKWVKFLWAYIKPHRIYIHSKTVHNASIKCYHIQQYLDEYLQKKKSVKQKWIDKETMREHISIINSYLGMMQHRQNYKKRIELVTMLSKIYEPNDLYTKITLKKDGSSTPPTSV